MKKSYSAVKKFLDGFTLPPDYSRLKTELDELSKVVCEDYKIADKFLSCRFVKDKNFGKTASVSDKEISINSLRLDALFALSFDDTRPRHLQNQLDKFVKNYDSTANHSTYEAMLYKFICDMNALGCPELIKQSGSYKTIKYEFIDIVFHENRHIVQKTYIPLLTSPKPIKTTDELVLMFTMLFDEIRHDLIKAKKIEWDYQDNSTFPIEFDARYISLVNLNEVRKLYYSSDKLFSSFIIRNSLVGAKLNSEREANKLFKTLENYYSLSKFEKYKSAYEIVIKNKDIIITELVRRFNEMKDIVKENKAALLAK